jgi:hypothetical protein
MADVFVRVSVEDYDLIFVDDSLCMEERSTTIRTVGALRPQRAVVVMHDFENLPYREAAKQFHRCYRVTQLNPNTGVAWNRKQIASSDLHRLNRLLHKQGPGFDLGDRDSWLRWMERHFMGQVPEFG